MHAVVDQMGDPVREHPRLAGAGTGDHEQRAGFVRDRVELVGVEALGERRRAIPRERIPDRIRRRALCRMGNVVGEQLVVSHVQPTLESGCRRPCPARSARRGTIRGVARAVRMMTRNMVWLAVIVAVGLIGWLAFGLVVGLIAAAVTLVVSEVFERWARARRRTAQTSP